MGKAAKNIIKKVTLKLKAVKKTLKVALKSKDVKKIAKAKKAVKVVVKKVVKAKKASKDVTKKVVVHHKKHAKHVVHHKRVIKTIKRVSRRLVKRTAAYVITIHRTIVIKMRKIKIVSPKIRIIIK